MQDSDLISQLPALIRARVYAKGLAMLAPARWVFLAGMALVLALAEPFEFSREALVSQHLWIVGIMAWIGCAVSELVRKEFGEQGQKWRRTTAAISVALCAWAMVSSARHSELPFPREAIEQAWAEPGGVDKERAVFQGKCSMLCVPASFWGGAGERGSDLPTLGMALEAAATRNGLWIDAVNIGVVWLFCLVEVLWGCAMVMAGPSREFIGSLSLGAGWRKAKGLIEAAALADPAERAILERKALDASACKAQSHGEGASRL